MLYCGDWVRSLPNVGQNVLVVVSSALFWSQRTFFYICWLSSMCFGKLLTESHMSIYYLFHKAQLWLICEHVPPSELWISPGLSELSSDSWFYLFWLYILVLKSLTYRKRLLFFIFSQRLSQYSQKKQQQKKNLI